jgi:hypothetical protein
MQKYIANDISIVDIEIFLREKKLIFGPCKLQSEESCLSKNGGIRVFQPYLEITESQQAFLNSEIRSIDLSKESKTMAESLTVMFKKLPEDIRTFEDCFLYRLKDKPVLSKVISNLSYSYLIDKFKQQGLFTDKDENEPF